MTRVLHLNSLKCRAIVAVAVLAAAVVYAVRYAETRPRLGLSLITWKIARKGTGDPDNLKAWMVLECRVVGKMASDEYSDDTCLKVDLCLGGDIVAMGSSNIEWVDEQTGRACFAIWRSGMFSDAEITDRMFVAGAFDEAVVVMAEASKLWCRSISNTVLLTSDELVNAFGSVSRR